MLMFSLLLLGILKSKKKNKKTIQRKTLDPMRRRRGFQRFEVERRGKLSIARHIYKNDDGIATPLARYCGPPRHRIV